MQGVIPVAGMGRRLRPHTYTTPKALLAVAGKPILGYILDEFSRLDLQEVILIIGSEGYKIVNYVNSNYRFKTRYVVQQEPRGIAHAIWLARSYLGDNPLLIALGDTLFEADLTAVIARGISAIGVKEVHNPQPFGVVEQENGHVIHLVEKPTHPPSNLIIAGLYYIADSRHLVQCLNRLQEENITTKGEYQLTDALQLLIEGGEKVVTFPVVASFDCGTPEMLLATNRYLLSKSHNQYQRPGCLIVPPVFIASSAHLDQAIIGPYVSVAEQAVVKRAIVRNTIIGTAARIQNCLLEASLIGADASVEARPQRLNLGDSCALNLTP